MNMARIEIPYDEYRKLVDAEQDLSRERDLAVAGKEYSDHVCSTCREIIDEIEGLSLWDRVFHWKGLFREYKRKTEKA